MIKKYSLVCIALLCTVLSGFGQVTIFSENMGMSTAGDTSIAASTFENSLNQTFMGDVETRITTPSSGYPDASGGRNVFVTNQNGRYFEISGINTIGYTALTLTLGHYKSSTAGNNELVIEVSTDGTTYTPLTYSRATGTGTANWVLITPIGTIPSTTNLRLRFTQTSNLTQFRVDDVILSGMVTSTNFVDYCNLQFPQNGNIAVGTAFNVYAQVYEAGVTEIPFSQGANIDANLYLAAAKKTNTERTTPESKPINLLLGKLILDDVKVVYNNTAAPVARSGMDFNHLRFSKMNLEVRNFHL